MSDVSWTACAHRQFYDDGDDHDKDVDDDVDDDDDDEDDDYRCFIAKMNTYSLSFS